MIDACRNCGSGVGGIKKRRGRYTNFSPYSRKSPGEGLFRWLIESEIQLKNVDARLAHESKGAPCRVLSDDLQHLSLSHSPRPGDARCLKEGVVRRDVRIEARTGRGDCIDGNRAARVLGSELVDVALDTLHQLDI